MEHFPLIILYEEHFETRDATWEPELFKYEISNWEHILHRPLRYSTEITWEILRGDFTSCDSCYLCPWLWKPATDKNNCKSSLSCHYPTPPAHWVASLLIDSSSLTSAAGILGGKRTQSVSCITSPGVRTRASCVQDHTCWDSCRPVALETSTLNQ